MRESVNDYLKDAAFSTVMSLAEIIPFNKDNPDLQAGIGKMLIASHSNLAHDSKINST